MSTGRDRFTHCPVPVLALLVLTACGRGSSPALVGGTVSGLIGQGLTVELLDQAATAHRPTVLEQIDIVANGAFVFHVVPSRNYSVAIVHQPHSPAQRCMVGDDQGVITTINVTDVGIVCRAFVQLGNSKSNRVTHGSSERHDEFRMATRRIG